ncbi:PTS sugar transporter subunit IIB [Chimaeribacter arupi]|uniref:PTS sugar transporter subunit IIB n=2 Tax=Yersiniaceae TaxID=1903411 RepID=A0A2N5EM93_9GAMM|nr:MULTISPECIES: PTS sugar transporter subunit IIB [Yersiniaceae]MBS0969604.1 PTS sugar transporter subunit IIB [Nissabacter archeti]MDV5142343.1 PTS sugar transporter subunit IIB [Chimaeribacter arupi]PLR35289.1 PTS sugar transporter subunit IIB [Chimaeribacter arupi]PLR44085.1 PTS sugar transporter subunit IIB [Chimaeribacter arupi]PLR48496.1 PTS sugar transporter subunit IIB [Chimaeribacter arupi]
MKKIVLCCAAGMSTSMLVQRMRQEAEKRQIEVDIEAVPVSDFELVVKDADVILLGPQVKFQLKRLQEAAAPLGKPVDVIDMMDYGTMRGDKVLDKALSLIA